MKNNIVYIKLDQHIEVSNQKVYLGDIAKIYSPDSNMVSKLNLQLVKEIESNQSIKYCFSILKVVELIHQTYPEVEVVNLGETDFILSYVKPKQEKKAWEIIKAILVGLVVFSGGAFSIMTFNADVSVADVFDKAYELVTGSSKTTGTIVELGYSIGIPIGILVFYNHFSKLKLHSDPTPIQMEMRKYEKDINNALIEETSREGKTIDCDSR